MPYIATPFELQNVKEDKPIGDGLFTAIKVPNNTVIGFCKGELIEKMF